MADETRLVAMDSTTGKLLYKTPAGYTEFTNRDGKLCDQVDYEEPPPWAAKIMS